MDKTVFPDAVVNTGAGMAAMAIDVEDGTRCSCQCQGWGLSQSSMLELGAGHDRQRWGWGLLRPSTQEVSMASVVVNAGDRDSTVISNTRLLSGKKKELTCLANRTDIHFDHLAVKKSARFYSSTLDVILPMYRCRDCLDKFKLLPMLIGGAAAINAGAGGWVWGWVCGCVGMNTGECAGRMVCRQAGVWWACVVGMCGGRVWWACVVEVHA